MRLKRHVHSLIPVHNHTLMCYHAYVIVHVNDPLPAVVRGRFFKKGGILSACYQLVPTSADDLFTKGRSICHHVYVIMHVKKDPLLSVVRGPVCFRKVEFYQHVTNLSPPVPTTGSQKAVPCVIISM